MRNGDLACSAGEWESVAVKAYEEVAEFIERRDPREVAGFRPSPEARQRAVTLVQREKATGLSLRNVENSITTKTWSC